MFFLHKGKTQRLKKLIKLSKFLIIPMTIDNMGSDYSCINVLNFIISTGKNTIFVILQIIHLRWLGNMFVL